MWLIVGLGNPGTKYLLTRHNIGFMVLDAYLASIGSPPDKKEKKALTYHFRIDKKKVLFAKPQTFMNLSGDSVQPLSQFYDVDVTTNLIVVHDEIDLPFGQIKVQQKRGHGGQNGIRDIHQKLGTNNYIRVRMGVGRPSNSKMDVGDYVLQNFSKEDTPVLPDILQKGGDAIESIIFDGFGKAATKFNQKGSN